VMAASAAVAVFLKDLSRVFDLTGSIAAYPIDFVFPAVCYAKVMFYDESEEDESFFRRRQKGCMGKMKKLMIPQMIPVVLMSVIAMASSVISLYVTITDEFLNADN